MLDDPLLPPPNLDIAPGWGGVALARLERLAELAMQSVEDLLARQVESQDNAEAVKAATALAAASRNVRLTLILQAKVLSGDPSCVWRGAVEHPENLNYDPDPEDPDALTKEGLETRAAAELRLHFAHVLNDPDLIDLTAEKPHEALYSLHEALERAIEHERERPEFRRGPDPEMVLRLCEKLGVPWRMNVLQNSAGQPQVMVVSRPSDPDNADFITWHGQGPYHRDFMEPWVRPKPPP
jgi:hypothetical protein